MEEINFIELELEGVPLKNICLEILDYIKKNNKSEANKIYADDIFGNISYKIIEDLIEISFENNPTKIEIYKNPIVLKNEENKEIYKAFNKELLDNSLKMASNYYEFYAKGKIQNISNILLEKPSEIILKKKNLINFDIFELLNGKTNLISEKTIIIETNKILPENINSLDLKRNNKLEVILYKRNDLLNEINNFYDSDEVLLKIYGTDGIGKSLSFIYLQSLICTYKIVYLNLKEFNSYSYNEKIINFKKQLLMYYSQKNNNIKEKKKLNLFNFNRYKEAMDKLDEEIEKCNKHIDFWVLLELLIKINKLNNVLYILDQYKEENDKNNSLDYFENIIIDQKTKSKLLIVFSINDGKVKYELVNIFKTMANKESITNLDEDKININNENNKIEKFFESYNENQNYIDEIISEDDKELFPKILDFNLSDNPTIENNNFGKFLVYENTKNIKTKTKFIYINKLVSVQYLKNDKNNNLIDKMQDFDYNPKYYFKWEKFYLNNKNYKIEELYIEFLKEIYKQISNKIVSFYKGYCLKYQNKLVFEETIVKYLVILLDLVKKEKKLSFNELIDLLEYFPLKYIKIDKVEETSNNIMILNKDLIKYKYKLSFVFPFMEIVIRKYIYDTGIIGNINFTNLSPSGIGAILEIEILKSIMNNNSTLIQCKHRIVWGFKQLKDDKNKISETIDIYNLKRMKLDDGKNPLDNCYTSYYITPYNPNNEYLDSVFLIPYPFNNDQKKEYCLVATQITIRKDKIYSKEEYQESANICAKLLENIYGIKIIEKFFIFILAKEYNNLQTQKDLQNKEIPYIFFSINDKYFYFDGERKIKGIRDLLKNKFKIETENDKICEEYLYFKNTKLKVLQDLLNRKRKNDNIKITKNLFSYARKKIFNNYSLSNINLVKNKIIKYLHQIESFKNKKLTIEFVFKIPFLEINNINLYRNLFGILAYSGKLFLFYDNKNIIELYHQKNKQNKSSKNQLNDLICLIFSKSYSGSNEKIIDYLEKDERIQSIDDIINSSTYKPSEIFVYSIYEIDETIN